ncbi:class I SAM-dependent methyltransferase [Anatilimnocola sp. NA78]|uniref:class I SAM-dependent methyltransferase n=1 Tax=Anatilimnocola sp. NA78 TaxID=3415683 RepID=UPI003CE535D5
MTNDGIQNLFAHRSAAQRYATARPYFHPLVMDKIVGFTKVAKFGRAIDIACGTGLSSRALTAIADQVAAVDISPEMLAEALPHERIHYQVSPAERTPFDSASFDLATVGLAFHWFDQAAFLREAKRILALGGWLVIYNSGFLGEMVENPAFRAWGVDLYQRQFPTPARRSFGITGELAEEVGLSLVGNESFTHFETMTAEQLTSYLLTQTNVIAAVEAGSMPLAEAASWIATGAAPYFRDQPGTMKFGGTIWYLSA